MSRVLPLVVFNILTRRGGGSYEAAPAVLYINADVFFTGSEVWLFNSEA